MIKFFSSLCNKKSAVAPDAPAQKTRRIDIKEPTIKQQERNRRQFLANQTTQDVDIHVGDTSGTVADRIFRRASR